MRVTIKVPVSVCMYAIESGYFEIECEVFHPQMDMNIYYDDIRYVSDKNDKIELPYKFLRTMLLDDKIKSEFDSIAIHNWRQSCK